MGCLGWGGERFLHMRVPREGWRGPDGVTREWGGGEVRVLGRVLDMFVSQDLLTGGSDFW